MKPISIGITVLVAVSTALSISFVGLNAGGVPSASAIDGAYSWVQAAGPEKGCWPDCKEGEWCWPQSCAHRGEWPMAIVPIKAFGDKLWMIGRNFSWSSKRVQVRQSLWYARRVTLRATSHPPGLSLDFHIQLDQLTQLVVRLPDELAHFHSASVRRK